METKIQICMVIIIVSVIILVIYGVKYICHSFSKEKFTVLKTIIKPKISLSKSTCSAISDIYNKYNNHDIINSLQKSSTNLIKIKNDIQANLIMMSRESDHNKKMINQIIRKLKKNKTTEEENIRKIKEDLNKILSYTKSVKNRFPKERLPTEVFIRCKILKVFGRTHNVIEFIYSPDTYNYIIHNQGTNISY